MRRAAPRRSQKAGGRVTAVVTERRGRVVLQIEDLARIASPRFSTDARARIAFAVQRAVLGRGAPRDALANAPL